MSEVYISVDVETDGKLPPMNSMLSLGAAAFTPDGTMTSTFFVNLDLLPSAAPDPDTMAWWSTNQAAYDATRINAVDPKIGIGQFVDWVKEQPGKPVCVAYPLPFDWSWLYWYIVNFGYESPFGFSNCLDIKSYACAMLKTDFRKTTKKNMPKHWFPKEKHTHVAIEDAIEQGKLFINMLKENLSK